MYSVISRAPARRPPPDDYAVTAEFYDVLQAEQDEALVRELYGRDAADACVGVLDIGAGTGRVTMMCLGESRVDVHAVEPSRAMRAPLMTRLAALPRAPRERVTVHPRSLEETALHEVADVAICHNTIACLAPEERRALWPAVARALVPGGSLVFQLPPARVPDSDTVRVFPLQTVGQHVYGGHMAMSAVGDRIRTRCHYWVRGSEGLLSRHTETFWMWPAARADLLSDLAGHGFAPLPLRRDPAVLAVTLVRPGPRF
ncbi:class I SAM-dependent methyltransferase [Streptomyces sp. NPDC057362]|uniref:class I SAM-dependent methyltransferase n=1 Tax=Streptomyces sp. NPDC057362 TaxID=3346106 RepID=UPI00363C32A8